MKKRLTAAKIDELISELNVVARDYDHYEYGLPVPVPGNSEEVTKKMRDAVRKWVKEVSK